MERRSFFKVMGLTSAALAAGGVLAGCDALRGGASGSGAATSLHATSQPAVQFSKTVDVLVVGSGVAGLSAAMPAAEAGKQVYIADKRDLLGGNSYLSTGVLHVANAGVQQRSGVPLDPAAAWKQRRADLAAAGVTDLDFAKTLYEGASEWVDHVESEYKAQFANPATYQAEGLASTVVLPKNGLEDMESILVPVRDGLAAKGVTFATGYRATGLVVDESEAVRGVRFSAEQGAAVIDIAATCVVLATGGYASSQSLVHTNNPDWEHVGSIVTVSTGDAQQLCQPLGATNAGYTSGLPLISDLPSASAWGMFARVLGVDAVGARFAREDDMNTLATKCFSDVRGYWWTIYDNRLNSCSQARSVASITSKNAKRIVGPCADVDALAAAMGVPKETLRATFDRYNALVDGGKDDDYGRAAHWEKLEAPYYALKQFPLRYRTRGGVKTDAQGRVMRTAGAAAVPGLYCCGAAAAAGGEGVASNGAFGLIVGRSVVDYLNARAGQAADGAAGNADDAADGTASQGNA